MADSGAHGDLLATAFPNFTIGLQPPLMRYQDGNVIIKFSDKLEDKLLLPQGILSDPSTRFRTRFKSTSFAGGREVPHKGGKVTVYKYHLAVIEKTFCLTDEGDLAPTEHRIDDYWVARMLPFSRSALSETLPASRPVEYHGEKISAIRARNVFAHKIAFALLVQEPIDFDLTCIGDEDALSILIDTWAIAEYWHFLPRIAARVTALLEGLPELWTDIANHPHFWL